MHSIGRADNAGRDGVPGIWPWGVVDFKPGNRIRDLEKAGALIAAELDNIARQKNVSSIAGISVITSAMAAKALAEVETDRIGGLCRDGHITEREAAEMIARITP